MGLGVDIEASHLQRVNGEVHVGFRYLDGQTRLLDSFQKGSAKVRFPKVYNAPITAVLINTAGGLTGGDKMSLRFHAAAHARAITTSQTAERAYRSASGDALVDLNIDVDAGAFLEWLPQETILFDGSRLRRRLNAHLALDARLLMVESFVLGRQAMGEQLTKVFFSDKWRVYRDQKLIFADDVRFDGDPCDFFGSNATGAKSLAGATLLDCANDAEDRLEAARSHLNDVCSSSVFAGVSAWNGVLVARFVAENGQNLRQALMKFLVRYRAADLPRVWHC